MSEPLRRRMLAWMRRRVWQPILAQLLQGLSPERLAASLAVGIACSVFPVLGATTLLAAGVAALGRLNQPVVQLANYLAYPLQLLLLLPFIRVGERLFGAPRLPLDALQILQAVQADPMGAIRFLWTSTWHAVVAWALVVPLAAAVLALLLGPVLRLALRRWLPPSRLVEA